SNLPRPPSSILFPYTTLFRSARARVRVDHQPVLDVEDLKDVAIVGPLEVGGLVDGERLQLPGAVPTEGSPLGARIGRSVAGGSRDRKSTRLNSSHVKISYAVF